MGLDRLIAQQFIASIFIEDNVRSGPLHLYGSSQIPITPIPEDLMSHLTYEAHTWCIHAHSDKTFIHINI